MKLLCMLLMLSLGLYADIGTKLEGNGATCLEYEQKPGKTCTRIENSSCKYSRGEIRYIHSEKDVFKKAYVYYSKNFISKKCFNDGRTLDLYFHGKGGSYVGRFHDEYKDSDCRVSFAPKYNTISSYYDYSKLSNIKISDQKEVLVDYLTKVLKSLEKNLCSKIKEITISGHSQGGVMLSIFAQNFPSGTIKLKGRSLRIKGYFNADANYFRNLDFFNVLFLHMLEEGKEGVLEDVLNRYMGYVYKDHKYKKSELKKMITDIYKRTDAAVDGAAKLPLYYNSALDQMWAHQSAIFRFASEFQSPKCGMYGIRTIWYDYSNSGYFGTKLWKKKTNKNKSLHWQASGSFIRNAIDYFDGEKSETWDCL